MATDLQELIEILPDQSLAVFTAPISEGIQPFLDKIRVQLDGFVPDMSCEAGRAEIKSLAFKITKSKTYLDGVGKELNDKQKEIPKRIDAARKHARDTLDGWAADIRKPLTDWEEKEDARLDRHAREIERLDKLKAEAPIMQLGAIRAAIESLTSATLNQETCDEFVSEYVRANEGAITALKAALLAAEKAEADRAELERLRAAEAARQEETRIAERAAAEIARRAEVLAAAQQAERDAAAQREAALIAEREAADRRTEAAAAEERRRIAAEEAERDRLTAERAADRAHRSRINRAALSALVAGGVTEDMARKCVEMIAKGEVPAIAIKY